MTEEHPFRAIEETFKRAVAALQASGVDFMLGGSLACWAQGGPATRNDLDFMLKREDAERAMQALVEVGMRRDEPNEDWLVKAWDGDVLVDLIHRPTGFEITDEVLARAKELEVVAMRLKVMALEDVLSSKLLALGEHNLDMEGSLQIARALREQIDFRDVAARTADSPYARAFMYLLDELGITAGANAGRPAKPGRVRVVG